jgi:hypothetical protein
MLFSNIGHEEGTIPVVAKRYSLRGYLTLYNTSLCPNIWISLHVHVEKKYAKIGYTQHLGCRSKTVDFVQRAE